jgi:hypothetical protein
VLATEAFQKLLMVTLHARRAPESLAVVLKGNPEFLEPAALEELADTALREAVQRLTTGGGKTDGL